MEVMPLRRAIGGTESGEFTAGGGGITGSSRNVRCSYPILCLQPIGRKGESISQCCNQVSDRSSIIVRLPADVSVLMSFTMSFAMTGLYCQAVQYTVLDILFDYIDTHLPSDDLRSCIRVARSTTDQDDCVYVV
jgi:hypothetical protein